MKLLSFKDTPAELEFINDKFPFCFLNGFSTYVNDHKKNQLVFLSDGRSIIPAEIRNIKQFIALQFQFQPLNYNAQPLEQDEEKKFLEVCVDFITQKKLAHRILQPANYAVFSAVPSGSRSAAFGTYFLDLRNKTAEEIIGNMQARYRTAIRQVERSTYTIEEGEKELQAFAQLHEETMKRSGGYCESPEELSALKKHLGETVQVRNIYMDNTLQGGLIVLATKYGGYYLHGGSADTSAAQGAIKFLHYNTMLKLAQEGTAFYDFVGARLSDITGTKLEGIQNFKKRFGTELKKGYLWKKDIDTLKCNIFDYALRTKNLLKGAKNPEDIIEQELKKTI